MSHSPPPGKYGNETKSRPLCRMKTSKRRRLRRVGGANWHLRWKVSQVPQLNLLASPSGVKAHSGTLTDCNIRITGKLSLQRVFFLVRSASVKRGNPIISQVRLWNSSSPPTGLTVTPLQPPLPAQADSDWLASVVTAWVQLFEFTFKKQQQLRGTKKTAFIVFVRWEKRRKSIK